MIGRRIPYARVYARGYRPSMGSDAAIAALLFVQWL